MHLNQATTLDTLNNSQVTLNNKLVTLNNNLVTLNNHQDSNNPFHQCSRADTPNNKLVLGSELVLVPQQLAARDSSRI